MDSILKKPQLSKFFPNLLILMGILLVLSPLIVFRLYNGLPASAKEDSVALNPYQTLINIPTFIEIKGVINKIPVGIGHFKQGEWDLTDNKALYLFSSGAIGQKGNGVIYGHNTQRIFGNLSKAKVGEEVEITTSSGTLLKYRIYNIRTVSPSNVEVLSQEGDERITIFTCNGLFDSTRLVIEARRIN